MKYKTAITTIDDCTVGYNYYDDTGKLYLFHRTPEGDQSVKFSISFGERMIIYNASTNIITTKRVKTELTPNQGVILFLSYIDKKSTRFKVMKWLLKDPHIPTCLKYKLRNGGYIDNAPIVRQKRTVCPR